MKLLLVTATIIIVANALSDVYQWQEFKRNHGKSYRSLVEEKKRFSIFQSNLRLIEAHNERYARGEVTYKEGITVFTDVTNEEFESSLIQLKPRISENRTAVMGVGDIIPESLNWTAKGAVSKPRQQGRCGGCWAFVSAAAVEARVFIETGVLTELSVQNLIDCSTSYGNAGCKGGDFDDTFSYIEDYGILTEEEYPYVGHDERCYETGGIVVSDYFDVPSNARYMQAAVAKTGPICVGIHATIKMKHYLSGVIDKSIGCRNDEHSLNHAILVVGYGVENGRKYWICKNSWGTKWGEAGYFKLQRGDDNTCGVNIMPSYPVL